MKAGIEAMIEITHLSKHFEQTIAVDDLSFKVSEGEVLGFLGPNGAGKSTTMKIITGFLAPTSGSVTVDGHDIVTDALAAKALMGYLPEGAPSYGDMTTLDFLRFVGEIRGYRGDELVQRVGRVLAEVELGLVALQKIETLSKGFKRRVGLAQAIMHDPKVLILDEPTDGLDPNQKQHVRELIQNLARDKIVIISTHILEEVSAVCTRAVIIANGRLVADGTPAELEASSKYHQAVNVRLTQPVELGGHLDSLADVAGIEVDARDVLSLRILAQSGKSIYRQVAKIAQDQNWPIAEMTVTRGQLEDVFKQVTAGGARHR
jgi:ABC-2 type transport system ATP-binding protein